MSLSKGFEPKQIEKTEVEPATPAAGTAQGPKNDLK